MKLRFRTLTAYETMTKTFYPVALIVPRGGLLTLHARIAFVQNGGHALSPFMKYLVFKMLHDDVIKW